MKEALILEHKTYISAKRAAELTGYASDYVGQLCRAGKIESKIVGRSWFVLESSLMAYKAVNDEVKTNKKTAWKRRVFQTQQVQTPTARKPVLLLNAPGAAIIAPVEIAPIISPIIEPVASLFVYEAVKSPLIPLLNKKAEQEKARISGREIEVRFVPAHFSMRGMNFTTDGAGAISGINSNMHSVINFAVYSTFKPTLTKESSFIVKNFAIALLLVLVISSGAIFTESAILKGTSVGGQASEQASVASVSSNFFQSVARGFDGLIGIISDRFAFRSGGSSNPFPPVVAEAPAATPVQSAPANDASDQNLGFNGIAVVPSTNSETKDDAIKQVIRNSFSDDVTVHPDQSGTAGIITPVFKKAADQNFVYVLVPAVTGGQASSSSTQQ